MYRLVLAGFLPVLLVASAEAQPSPVVTEAEFLSVLDDGHPAVVDDLQAVAMARARVVGASTFENPTLGINREDLSGPTEEMEWTLSWQLPESSRRLGIQAREEALGAAEARLAQNVSSLRLEMRQVYAEWAIASVRRERLSVQAARIEALADRENRRAEQGEASGLEAHRLSLAAAGLQAQVALAAAAEEDARGRARSWYPDLAAEAQPFLPSPPPAPELDGDHPLLQAALADLETAILEQKAAGRFVRSPEVKVGWKRVDTGTESFDGPVLGLGWSVPLFARNQSEKALVAARLATARARVEIVRREIASSRASSSVAYQHLLVALGKAEAALGGNEKMLAGAEAAFRRGEGTLTDLLDTLRSAAEAEESRLDLQEAALAAHRDLQRLVAYLGAGRAASPSPTLSVSQEPSP